jgi:hypothetical protein
MFANCPECSQPIPVEYIDVGVGFVWHGVHCGWSHEFSQDCVYGMDFGEHIPNSFLLVDLIYCERCGYLLYGLDIGMTKRVDKECNPTRISLRS